MSDQTPINRIPDEAPPTVLASPAPCVLPFRPVGVTSPEKIARGALSAETATMVRQLRQLAQEIESGERDDLETLLVIPVHADGTETPYMFGAPMRTTTVVGTLAVAKVMVIDSMYEDRA